MCNATVRLKAENQRNKIYRITTLSQNHAPAQGWTLYAKSLESSPWQGKRNAVNSLAYAHKPVYNVCDVKTTVQTNSNYLQKKYTKLKQA